MKTTAHSQESNRRTRLTRAAGAGFLLRCAARGALAFLLCITAAAQSPQYVPGRILVKPKAYLTDKDFSDRLRPHQAVHGQTLPHSNVRVVAVAEEKAEAALAALRNDPDIEFAERDYIVQASFVPNDPYVVDGSEWHLAKIQALQAWDIATVRVDVVIAVLDSGVNAAHPDLAGNLLPGYDFVSNESNPADDFGHGTAVTGTLVAAANNGVGVAGVAYGCHVLPVKVMDASGSASHSCVAQGIEYAVQQGARVINLSMGGDYPSSTLQNAINYAWSNNVVVVAAAGNNGSTVPQYPAACEHVLAVSATTPDDSRASFSTYGNFVTLSAPGVAVWTTQRDLANPYGPWSGTSFSSPIVAGVAALVASANPSLSNTQIMDILKQTADDLGPAGYDTSFGFGRVNALRAVSAANPGQRPPPPATGPTVNVASPPDAAEFAFGAKVSVAATASKRAAGGNVINVAFFANALQLTNFAVSPFAFDWEPAQAGSYSLVAVATDDAGLSSTSAPVTIRISSPETVPPSLSLTVAPPNGARLFSPLVNLAGTARDNSGIRSVEVRMNAGPSQPARGTTNWSAQVALAPGPNVIRMHSVDLAGNISRELTRAFTYVVNVPLAVQTNGLGTVAPDLNGTQLEIGRTYRVRALPGPGQVFTGWDGMPWQSPVLTFVMQSNLMLVANFVPNPFLNVRGSYAGLLANTNGITPDSSGYFALAVTASGRFSGRLLLGAARHGFRGQFNLAGDAAVNVPRALAGPLNVLLHIDLTKGTDQTTGSVADGNFVSEMAGDRNIFNAQLHPATQAGVRSFILERTGASGAGAAGWSRISRSGAASVRGRLGDGRVFGTASTLAKSGDYPFYLTFNGGSEVVIGWLNFPAGPVTGPSGTLLWVKTGTNAFAATLQAAAAQP